MDSTLIEKAEQILEAVRNDGGKALYVGTVCQFILNGENQHFTVDGMFDRIYQSPVKSKNRRLLQRHFTSNISRVIYAHMNIFGMANDCLRMLTLVYHPKKCICCDEFFITSASSNDYICDHCLTTVIKHCSVCGFYTSFDDEIVEKLEQRIRIRHATYRRIGGYEKVVCKHCASSSSNFIKCDCCHNEVYRGETVYGETIPALRRESRFCNDCATAGKVLLCHDCNNYFVVDKIHTNGLCMKCSIRRATMKRRADIHSHTYKPRPIFISTTPVTKVPLGLELEVDDGNYSTALSEYIAEIQQLYLKSDGSLSDGFEIVTYPLSLDYHKTVMPYDELFRRLHADGYTSNDNSTCGLHIHVGRSGLGATARSQNPAIGRLIWVFEAFKDQIKKFSRRKEYRYCSFYGLPSSYTPKQMLDYVKQDNRNNRYRVINLQNANTVEVRVFKGTLKKETVLASLELCDYVVKYVTTHKDDTMYNPSLTWQNFASEIRSSDYPNLRSYMIRKHLI
jgi:hypothetical protein